jgi:hypothetical protein
MHVCQMYAPTRTNIRMRIRAEADAQNAQAYSAHLCVCVCACAREVKEIRGNRGCGMPDAGVDGGAGDV